MPTALRTPHEIMTMLVTLLNGWERFYRVHGKPWRRFEFKMVDWIPAGTTIYLLRSRTHESFIADRFRVISATANGKKRHALICTDDARIFSELVTDEELERAVSEYSAPVEWAERIHAERDYCRGSKG